MSHPGTEETLLDEGETASGLWWCFGSWLRFLFGFGLLVFFSPHHFVFPSPSMMTWALRPHGIRTRGKKITSRGVLLQVARSFEQFVKKGKAQHGEAPTPGAMLLTNASKLDKPQWLRFLPPNTNDQWREDFHEAIL